MTHHTSRLLLFTALLLGSSHGALEARDASAPQPEASARYDVIAPAAVNGPAHLRGARYRLTGGDSTAPLLRSLRYTLQASASYAPADAVTQSE